MKVIMTAGMDDPRNVVQALESLCDTYLVKPVHRAELIGHVRGLGLIP